jgi:hypothetical protein
MAPEFTMGLVRPPGARSTASMELNGRPVASTPTVSPIVFRPTAWQARASTKGLATLMSVKCRAASPASKTLPLTPVTQMPKRSAGTRARAG